MNEDWKAPITRRPILAALGAATGIVALGGAAYEGVRFWSSRGGPNADLLGGLGNTRQAMLVGEAVLADMPDFDAKDAAKHLQQVLRQSALADVLTVDATRGRIVETEGWVLPETLARLCAVVAKEPDSGSIKSHP